MRQRFTPLPLLRERLFGQGQAPGKVQHRPAVPASPRGIREAVAAFQAAALALGTGLASPNFSRLYPQRISGCSSQAPFAASGEK